MITRFCLPVRLCLLGLLLGIATPAMANKYKCWTNSDGIRECGHSVPPEYAQQRIEILNDKGIVIEVEEPAKTPQQLEEEARAAELREQQAQREAEKRLRDRVLLSTFTTERDLHLYYQDKTSSIRSQIDIARANNNSLQDELDDMQKSAANLERRGQTPSDELLEEMKETKRRIANNQTFIAGKEQEIEELNQQRDAELERFRVLKSASSP